MRLGNCHNFHDFRELARRRLPGPIFDYIAGGADDEATLRQNTASFERCDLVPNVLRGVEALDISVKVMGQKLAMPVYCSPTALQRLFHHDGERAVAAAAAKFGTMFGVSSLGTVSLEELRKAHHTSQIYQFYFHKRPWSQSRHAAASKGSRGQRAYADGGQHHRRQSRARFAHGFRHSLQTYAG